MKTLKVICMATVLGLVLSVPAYADDTTKPGDIDTPGLMSPTSSQLDSADFFEFLLTLVF